MPRQNNDRGLSVKTVQAIAEWINQKATPGRFDWIPILKGPFLPTSNTTISGETYTAINGLSHELTFNSRMRVAVDVFATCAVTVAPISGLVIRTACSPDPIASGGASGHLMVNDPGVYVVQLRMIYDVPANVPYTFSVEAALAVTAAGTVIVDDTTTHMTILAVSDPQF